MLENKKNKKIRIYILAVIILLVFFHYVGLLKVPESFVFDFTTNIQNKTYSFITRVKYSFINFQEAKNLKKENEEIKKQLNELTFKNNELLAFKGENEELRAIMNFHKDKEIDYKIAKIIGKDVNKDNTLIINLGKNDGMQEGLAAVVDQGVIIGKIIDVKNDISTILLLTDNLSQLAVGIQEINKTTGLAKGEFGLSIKVDLIPQDLDIQENDLIITSGSEENILRGLIIGKVNRIISHENDLFKSVTISPMIDFAEITVLSIVLPN